jgi:hypothetical protein
MATVMIALNIFFVALVVIAEVANFLYAIATQHRFHGVEASGSFLSRRVWSRRARPHAGPRRAWVVRRGQAWPAASS